MILLVLIFSMHLTRIKVTKTDLWKAGFSERVLVSCKTKSFKNLILRYAHPPILRKIGLSIKRPEQLRSKEGRALNVFFFFLFSFSFSFSSILLFPGFELILRIAEKKTKKNYQTKRRKHFALLFLIN